MFQVLQQNELKHQHFSLRDDTKQHASTTDPKQMKTINEDKKVEMAKGCILHVCTSCRPSGFSREPKEDRPGFILYRQLQEALRASHLKDQVEIKPAGCLSICPRPCGIAIDSSWGWAYLFGDQQPNETTKEIIDCISYYLETSNGLMARDKRPKALRSSILGRIPFSARS